MGERSLDTTAGNPQSAGDKACMCWAQSVDLRNPWIAQIHRLRPTYALGNCRSSLSSSNNSCLLRNYYVFVNVTNIGKLDGPEFDTNALLFALQNVTVEILSCKCSRNVLENSPQKPSNVLEFDVLPLV